MTGRTYRYMTQEPLFPFGHGLSYTSFCYGAVVLGSDNIKSGEKLRLSVPVTNTGKCDGEEVVQVYLKKNDDVVVTQQAHCVLSSGYISQQERWLM